MDNLTISGLARAAGVSIETIRYYQRRGLLEEPEKPLNGIRHYSADAAGRVRFIKKAQKLGFSLEEVGTLLALNDGLHCNEAREVAERKLIAIRSKLADLAAMEQTLTALVRQCERGGKERYCPIISNLLESENNLF